MGGLLISLTEPYIADMDISRLSSWQKVSQMQQIFWSKWSKSYLFLLQQRSKWRKNVSNIACGSLVLLKDENLPPLKWNMGRVVDVIMGEDGVARVAVIRTINCLTKRAVSKLAILPIEDNSVESHSLPTEGGCS